jgi:hypothetical protein
MIQQFSDSSVEFSANLMNPDGVALLGGWSPHSLWRVDEAGDVVAFLAQPVDGGRMETVAFSGFSTRPVFWMMHGATIELLYRALWRVALSTSTVRRILLVRFVDRLSFLTR